MLTAEFVDVDAVADTLVEYSNEVLGIIINICCALMLERGGDPAACSDYGDLDDDIDCDLVDLLNNQTEVLSELDDDNELVEVEEYIERCELCREAGI